MKIDNSVGSVGGPSSSEPRPRPTKGSSGSTAASPDAGSTVELSSLSAQLRKAEATLANVPVVDAGRVEEIKQAISEGRFKVDAGKVADGLISSVKQMLAAQARRA